MYARFWLCRKIFTTTAVVVWIVFAYRFKDYNKLNNKLLLDIKKQNSDLKVLLETSSCEYCLRDVLSFQCSMQFEKVQQIVLVRGTVSGAFASEKRRTDKTRNISDIVFTASAISFLSFVSWFCHLRSTDRVTNVRLDTIFV